MFDTVGVCGGGWWPITVYIFTFPTATNCRYQCDNLMVTALCSRCGKHADINDRNCAARHLHAALRRPTCLLNTHFPIRSICHALSSTVGTQLATCKLSIVVINIQHDHHLMIEWSTCRLIGYKRLNTLYILVLFVQVWYVKWEEM